MNTIETAIEVNNLTKYYNSTKGIENINFSVIKGKAHGFLGPNGAGKTTTIRILVGLLKQTSGSATILGSTSDNIEVKKKIGYIPSEYELYQHYTAGEYLHYISQLRGEAPLLDNLVSDFEVDLNKKTKELSKGNRQKINIIQALMHDPDLLIADEPTSGLDPLMQSVFEKTIKKMTDRGKTVLISSHVLSEVQNTCESITVIKDGNIVTNGTVDHLLKTVPRKAIIKIPKNISVNELQHLLDIQIIKNAQERLEFYFNYPVKEFVKRINQLDTIEDIFIPEPNLEEYFLPLYQK